MRNYHQMSHGRVGLKLAKNVTYYLNGLWVVFFHFFNLTFNSRKILLRWLYRPELFPSRWFPSQRMTERHSIAFSPNVTTTMVWRHHFIKVSIQPTFYDLLSLTILRKFFAAFIVLQFGIVIFFKRKLVQKLLVKCWWNWLQMSVSPTLYFLTQVFFETFLSLQLSFIIFCSKEIGAKGCF